MIKTFLLAADKFMPEMYLRHSVLVFGAVDHLIKIKKENKYLKKLELVCIFIKNLSK